MSPTTAPPPPPTPLPPANENPNGYITESTLIVDLYIYTIVILITLGLIGTTILLVPQALASIQRRRLIKMGGAPGDTAWGPLKNLRKAREWRGEVRVRKERAARERVMRGVGVGVSKGEEDVEMQYVRGGEKGGM